MFLKYNLPAIIWAAVIFILTMMPGKYIPPVNIWDIANFDKLAHIAVFTVLIVLALLGFLKQQSYKVLQLHPIVIGFTACSAYGLLLEIMQGTLLSDRYFELYDALANAIGCIIGMIFFRFVLQKKFRVNMQ